MAIFLRPATFNDLPAIVAIEQRAPGAAHWLAGQYNKLINDNGVIVAEEAGALCGFLCVKVVAGEWEIENIAVAVEFLRRRIASDLLGALLERARRETAKAIVLEVRQSNLPARRLYEKYGFREVGRRRLYYRDPEEDGILYTLSLNP